MLFTRIQRHAIQQISLSGRRVFISRRSYTTQEFSNGTDVLELLTEIKSKTPDKVDPESYFKILHHDPWHPEVHSVALQRRFDSSSLTVNDMAHLYNVLIKRFAKNDYSIATVARNALSKLPATAPPELRKPSIESLLELIRYNPGRVLSSWEIFISEIHDDDKVLSLIKNDQDLVAKTVDVIIEKLLYGDLNEIEDGFKPDVASLSKIYFVIHHYKDCYKDGIRLPSRLEEDLVEAAFQLDSPWIIEDIKISAQILLDKLADEPVSYTTFAILFTHLWNQDKNAIEHELLSKLLPSICHISTEGSVLSVQEQKSWDVFHSEISKLGISLAKKEIYQTQFQGILEEITSDMVAVDDLRIKVLLIHSYGIYGKDLTKAELFFNKYSQLEVNSPELVGALSLVYCYHSCLQNTEEKLDLATSLFDGYDNIPIKNLQALILANAYLGRQEESLNLFNSHIQKTNKVKDSLDGLSDSLLITESLILGYLYNLDREFAYLIHDGAVVNQILVEESDVLRFKALFKFYGEAFEEDDRSKAQLILGRYLIEHLKNLG